MNEQTQIADLVKRMREYSKLSQRELSAKTGITQADISKMERGLSNPSVSTLTRLADGAGVVLHIDFMVETDKEHYIIENLDKITPSLHELCNDAAGFILNEMGDNTEQIILYGSCARGDDHAESDVDIAILTDCSREDNNQFIDITASASARLSDIYGKAVNYICLPFYEFQKKKTWYPFFANIQREGIILYAR